MPRYTKSTTPSQLNQEINTLIQKNQDIAGDIIDLLLSLEECYGCTHVEKDLMTNFQYENILEKDDIDQTHVLYDIMGMQTTNKGITFIGLLAGTDYGLPFYMIVYTDDKNKLRGYIPKKGNAINPLTKQPFGDGDHDDDTIAKKIGFASYQDMVVNETRAEKHLYNKQTIIQDITKRLQLRP